jgi:hypothetical protein
VVITPASSSIALLFKNYKKFFEAINGLKNKLNIKTACCHLKTINRFKAPNSKTSDLLLLTAQWDIGYETVSRNGSAISV